MAILGRNENVMTKYTGYFSGQRNNIGKAGLAFAKASDLTRTKMKNT